MDGFWLGIPAIVASRATGYSQYALLHTQRQYSLFISQRRAVQVDQ
jgi:hypothetical protein